MPSSDIQTFSSEPAAPYFKIIPGEIRNQIFSLCISHELSHPKAQYSRSETKPCGVTVAVLSRRNASGYLRLDGIGPLPLMVVNKQTHNEVSSLVYALVEHVSIGSNISLYLDEDPNERWEFAYSLLGTRPYIQKLAKSVKVVLPRTPDDVLRTTYESLKKTPMDRQTARKSNAMALLPGLDTFLGNCESLIRFTIVIIEDKRDPPNFEDLLTLYGKYGELMTVRFERRFEDRNRPPRFDLLNWTNSTYWKTEWESCVREYEERTMVETA